METRLLLPSPNTYLPFCISNKFPLLAKPKLSVKPHDSPLTVSVGKSHFWGKDLILSDGSVNLVKLRKVHGPFGPIRATVKRRKEPPFDNVIHRDKKLKLVLKIRKILVNQPDRIMSLKQLGRFRRELGLDKKRRFIALLKKFPAVFQIVEEGVFSLKFKMTPEAERLYLEELRIRNEMEDLLVIKLRKLLMMSLEKRILLEKIAHLKTDIGLPHEFRDTICHRYPQYFRVVVTGRGPALELTHWDPELAVSAAELAEEENRIREPEEQNLIMDRPPRFNRVKLPKGLILSKGEMRKLMQFRDLPYISPYKDFSGLRPGTKEKEKHACGVVHEILSLTAEKETGILSLREAYQDSHLVEKDKLLLIKEKLRSLVVVSRFQKKGTPSVGGDAVEQNDVREDGSGEEDDEWSDIDNFLSDNGLEDGDDDDWTDEDHDTPPNFDKDADVLDIERRKSIKQVENSTENDYVALPPAFPDGRPRER